nr:hypothetical protein [Picobirnavirus sp.]
MTANQINAQSERELERHNDVVEQETERHNRALESLNDLEITVRNNYETERNRLTEQYNNSYIEYLNASLDQKERLEGELNSIKRLQTEADNAYKRQMASIESDRSKADIHYKSAMEEIGYLGQALEERKLDYQARQWETENSLKLLENQAKQLSISQSDLASLRNFNIQLKSLELQAANLQMEMAKASSTINLQESQRTRNYMDAASGLIKSATSVMSMP